MSSTFGWIEPAVAADTRVCVYDRAGRGWSELADVPQDAALIANDLHTLLERGRVPGPYVLAGHSFGGLYVLAYAAQYPDDIAGMVLVDTTLPSSATTTAVTSSSEVDSYNLVGRVSALLSTSARFGLGRLIVQADYGSLPPQSRDEQRASGATASHAQTTFEEYAMAGTSASQAAALVDFADRPLVVLTAEIGSSAAFTASHDDLATLSTNSSHRVIEGANHSALLHDEQAAAATTRAILDVVSSVRTGGQLG
jgi:pimeloyl-ACP methyl ester carboxylesterase